MELSLGRKGEKQESGICRKLALAGILAPLIFWLIPIFVAATLSDYNALRYTISALVLTPQGWLQTLAFCSFGILVMLFSFGLYSGIIRKSGLKASIVFLFLTGLGTLIIGIFPTDLGPTVSLHARIHHDTVKVVGALFPLLCFLLLPSLKADPRWKGFVLYTGFAGAVAVLLIPVWFIGNSTGWMYYWVGLYERIFAANSIIWLEVMAVRLILLPAGSERTGIEIKSFNTEYMGGSFWRHLGESARLVYLKIVERKPGAGKKSAVMEISRYTVFGALLAVAVRNYRRQNQSIKNNPKATGLPAANSVMFWVAGGLGRHLGLTPLTNLALTIVKDEKQRTSIPFLNMAYKRDTGSSS